MSSGGCTLTIRCQIRNRPGSIGTLITVIEEAGGHINGLDLVRTEATHVVRDINVHLPDAHRSAAMVAELEYLPDVHILSVNDRILQAHMGGKLAIQSRFPLTSREDLAIAYTPGVAHVCKAIVDRPERVHDLTIKHNSVAVITDGSAVLGLGNLGAEGSLPVMEGKAVLFKQFANIDAYPIALQSQDPETIIATVEQIAPVFGGINLEDISAPKCFAIENHLRQSLDIPVMHDDQHGTAVVTLAALWNALKLTGKQMRDLRVVVNGVGAAGTATIFMLHDAGVGEIIACDSQGIISRRGNRALNSIKQEIAACTNPDGLTGSLHDAIRGADVFIGVSVADILTPELVRRMQPDPIVFAMANPDPECKPELLAQCAHIVATGRSDYPNQINNVLAFPGIFRGALDAGATDITPAMRLSAAHAIASTIPDDELMVEYIVPSVFNSSVVPAVAAAVAQAARDEGVLRASHQQTADADLLVA